MVVEFEEFAAKFRERTAARMLEFEATLERIQQDVEKKAELDRQQEKENAARAGQNQAGTASVSPREEVSASSAARRARRPVHSVLRRD